ncbi:MAG: putative molybdenum carrier protein [Thermodesulfobacteriota bacterium]
MIKRIVSGGQTGADRAALDAAIELGVPHGGWIPKGRPAEDGPLPEKYQLQEMPTSGYPARTERNVVDSHGTLIVSHGEMAGGSALTKRLAAKYNRPCLHIDLAEINTFLAAGRIIDWLHGNAIEILNVAGPRASKDPEIYEGTLKLLKAVHHMATISEEPGHHRTSPDLPVTIEEAVNALIEVMSLKDRTKLANMPEEDLRDFQHALGPYVRNKLGLWANDSELLRACQAESGPGKLHPDSASSLIIEKLWKRLRATHTLRLVSEHEEADKRL